MTMQLKPSDAHLTAEAEAELKRQWMTGEISYSDYLWLLGEGEDNALHNSSKPSRRVTDRNKAINRKREYFRYS